MSLAPHLSHHSPTLMEQGQGLWGPHQPRQVICVPLQHLHSSEAFTPTHAGAPIRQGVCLHNSHSPNLALLPAQQQQHAWLNGGLMSSGGFAEGWMGGWTALGMKPGRCTSTRTLLVSTLQRCKSSLSASHCLPSFPLCLCLLRLTACSLLHLHTMHIHGRCG